MLHNIDTTGMISWHCHSMPDCSFHNCQGWDREDTCKFHPNQRNEAPGQTHTAHLSDPGVRFTTPELIELPACGECGEIMTLRVHSEEELTPPIITKDEQTGKILQVAPHPHPKFSGNLWIVDADIVRKQIPHPTLTHLTPAQIEQKQADLRNNAPDVPVDWMMSESVQQDIHHVYQHPAVARHRELADQLTAAGKVYTPPVVVTQETPEEMITRLLQEHGVITSPRLPATG